jgi:hypothetical protein
MYIHRSFYNLCETLPWNPARGGGGGGGFGVSTSLLFVILPFWGEMEINSWRLKPEPSVFLPYIQNYVHIDEPSM